MDGVTLCAFVRACARHPHNHHPSNSCLDARRILPVIRMMMPPSTRSFVTTEHCLQFIQLQNPDAESINGPEEFCAFVETVVRGAHLAQFQEVSLLAPDFSASLLSL